MANDINTKKIEKHTQERRMEILCLEAPDVWRLPYTARFLNEKKSVEGSLFIMHDYLGVKRMKIGFFHQKRLVKQQLMVVSMRETYDLVSMSTWGISH